MVAFPLLAATFAALLPAGSPPSPLTTAQGLALAYKKAIATRDGAWFDRTTAPDFTYTSIKNRLEERAQAIADLKAGFKAMKENPRVTIKVISAQKVVGGLRIVHDLTVTTTVEFGKPKPSILVFRTQQEVLFAPKGKSWLLRRIKILKDETEIDGKAIHF